jgi:mono/diheme cytochrome c family protein
VNDSLRYVISKNVVALALLAVPVLVFPRGLALAQGQPAPAGAQAPAASAQAPAGNAENGKKLWNEVGCWQCHGYAGQGGAGPKLAPNPIAYQGYTRAIRTPRSQMPPYTTKVLSDAQLADIYAFLKAVPPSKDPKEIPLLKEYLTPPPQ